MKRLWLSLLALCWGNAAAEIDCASLRESISDNRAIKAQYQTAEVTYRAWDRAVVRLSRTVKQEFLGKQIDGYDSITIGIRPDTYALTHDESRWVVHAYLRAMETDEPLDAILADRCAPVIGPGTVPTSGLSSAVPSAQSAAPSHSGG